MWSRSGSRVFPEGHDGAAYHLYQADSPMKTRVLQYIVVYSSVWSFVYETRALGTTFARSWHNFSRVRA